MVAQYPGTLEGMLLHALPPAAAEVLLRKLEAGWLGCLVCIELSQPTDNICHTIVAAPSSGALKVSCHDFCSLLLHQMYTTVLVR
jgi:hypothetical protein